MYYMKQPSYLEHCREAMASVDTQALAEMQLGRRIGAAGSSFVVRHLGTLTILNEHTASSAKVPLPGSSANRRLRQELATMTMITDHIPEARPLLPKFMGLVTVEGHNQAAALLTEDVTDNNRHTIQSVPVSQQYRDALATGFREIGTFEGTFRDEELRSSVAFSVDGQERWLDFTPSPINSNGPARQELRHYQYHVADSIDALACMVPADSPLAASLRPYMPD